MINGKIRKKYNLPTWDSNAIKPEYCEAEAHTLEREPTYCTHFGCGKMLTHGEKLFGDRCIAHQRTEKPIDEYLKQKENEKIHTHPALANLPSILRKRSKRRA